MWLWGAPSLWVPQFPHVKGKVGVPPWTLHPSPGGSPSQQPLHPLPTCLRGMAPPQQLPQGLGAGFGD